MFCWILGIYRFSVRSRGESLCLQVLIISNYLLFTWHFSIHLLENRHIVSYFPHLLSFVNHFPFQLLLVVSQFQNETNRVINLYHVKSLHYLFCCFCIGVLLESKGHLCKRFFVIARAYTVLCKLIEDFGSRVSGWDWSGSKTCMSVLGGSRWSWKFCERTCRCANGG